MELKDRLVGTLRALPLAHRIGMGAALVGLALVSVWFLQWVSAPTMTVLSSGLDSADVAEIVDVLEAEGVGYEIGNGGTTVLVPRNDLYATRAALAQAGVDGSSPQGYELLDGGSLTISDFQEQVGFKRAMEGELARTLMAMDGIGTATVLLVLPEEQLFTEQREPASASVLLDTTRPLNASEVEGVTFLVASSVEGLEASGISVVDASGMVLHAPGDGAVPGAVASRQLRETREFEGALEADITALLQRATGSPASVVVRATLDFDETSIETETYADDPGVTMREQTLDEAYDGGAAEANGVVGVDGGPLPDADGTDSTYSRSEVLREYGVDRTVTVTNEAPGAVDQLSVAIVMDDGTATGAAVPDTDEVERLVAAAVGLDAARGDVVEVSAVPFAAIEASATNGEAMTAMLDRVPQFIALLVLVLVAVGLFLMTRRRGEVVEAPALAAGSPSMPVIDVDDSQGAEPAVAAPEIRPGLDDQLKREVSELVERQPEEIATLLRGWLADQTSA